MAVVAVTAATTLAIYPTSDINNIGPLVRLIGLVGLALMVMSIFVGARWLVGWAAVILLVAYALSLIGRSSVDAWVPVYAAVMMLMIDTAYSSIERRTGMAGAGGPTFWQIGRLVVNAIAAGAATLLVLLLGSTPVSYGLLVQIAAVGAVGAVLTTLIVLVRQRT